MSAKSVLVIGGVRDYKGLVSHALTKGYKVLYTEGFDNGLPFIDRENVVLVVVDNSTLYMDSAKNPGLTKLIERGIPVILTGNNGFGDAIVKALQDQMLSVLRRGGSQKDIDHAVECFFNGRQEESTKSRHLIFRKEKDFVSLELDGNESGNTAKIERRIRRSITFMEEHYDEDISLDQIAHAAYLNPYYFCRLFRKQVGITCNKYLSILRIEKAKELLEGVDLSVTEICFEVGFNNLTHFERVFKGLEGMTPSAYRQSHR